ncbi:metallophosphoesterase [Mangrovibacterium sp.]|uniref:metallophosphoesterase n=1 Tax=Mangrovibacterium sp. TaxID=1961364 RepID=UPI003564C24D
MRGIPASGVILFFIVIFLIELFAYWGIVQLVNGKKIRRLVSFIYGLVSVTFLLIWLSAFLNPDKIRQTTDYGFFYFVISLSVLNLFPKSLIAIATIISAPLKLLRSKQLPQIILLSSVIISFGMILTIGYGLSVGKKNLQTNHLEIWLDDLPEKLDGLRVIQISDLHLGGFDDDQFLRKAEQKINELDGDILVITGDMVNNYHQEMIGFEEALERMTANYGKFAIFGNHDYGDYSNWQNPADKEANHLLIIDKIRAAGFQLLRNQSSKLKLADTSLYIVGVENWGHRPFPQYAELDSALTDVPENAFMILLSHDPAHWESEVVPETSIPLTLSGHTHGAQFGFKLAGISISPMYFIQPLWAGLYQNGNQYLYVNQGFGCVGFPGRIDMNPEITVLTLRSNSIKADRK